MRRGTAVSLVGLAIMTVTGSVEAQNRQDRRGFWIGFGVGGGSFGCEDCNREGGFSGHFKLGGTPSRKLLVGGYDTRLGRNFSLVPFLNFLGGSFDGDTANFWQLGVGLTWH
jgi:hypothetical protein